jgi:hypothetical protein
MKIILSRCIRTLTALAVLGCSSVVAVAQQTPTTPAPTPGALGSYFNDPTGKIPPDGPPGSPVTPQSTGLVPVAPAFQRIDAGVNFPDPDQGSRPTGQNQDHFVIVWLGTITAPENGSYTFRAVCDDGGRYWISKTLPLPAAPSSDPTLWKDQGDTNIDYTVTLAQNDFLYVRFEYYENAGGTTAIFNWHTPSMAAGAFVPVPASATAGWMTPGPCPTPALTATSVPGAAQIKLDWTVTAPTNAQTLADSYNIYRGTTAGGARVFIGNTAALTFTDTGAVNGPLTFGTIYYYAVQGVYSAGITTASPNIQGLVFGNPSNEAPCAVNPFAATPVGLLVVENGGTGTITITTSAAIPNGVVVTFPISIVTAGGGASFTSPASVTMTGNNTVGQNVQFMVTGVDNQMANDPKTATITMGPSSCPANAAFNNQQLPPVTCTQIESDIPGVIITPATGLAITNGGPAITFTVSLATIPQYPVTMTTSATIPYAAVVTPPTLNFSAGPGGNWNSGITVTVTPNNVDTTLNYLTSFYVNFTPVQSLDVNYSGINPGSAYIFEATSTPPLQSVWGSNSGCGLTGMESFGILALLGMLRRRRR